MSNIISYEQFEKVSNAIKEYVDSNIEHTQESIDISISTYINIVKDDIYNKLANEYASLETFLNYSDSLSLAFQLLQYGVNLKYETLWNSIEDVHEELQALKQDIYSNIQFFDEGIMITQKDSKYALDVTEKGVSIREDNVKIFDAVDNEVIANNLTVTDSFTLGSFKFVTKESGHMSLEWDSEYITPETAYPNAAGTPSTSLPIHTVHFHKVPLPGVVYTIEVHADMPSEDYRYELWANNNTVYVGAIYYEYFVRGKAFKSFIWPQQLNNISIRLVRYRNGNNKVQNKVTIKYVKLHEGDRYWVSPHNCLSYNNPWTELLKYSFNSSWDNGKKYVYTATYAYLEKGVVYNFSCNTHSEWGNIADRDTIFMYLCNKDSDDYTQRVNLVGKDCVFTVPETGIWYLRFDVMKTGVTHYFWNAKVVRTKIIEQFEDFIDQGAKDVYEEDDK